MTKLMRNVECGMGNPDSVLQPSACATGFASAFPRTDDPRVAAALAEYAAALEAGRPVDRDAFLSCHSDIAEPLAECLEALEFIHGAAAQVHGDDAASVEAFAGMPSPLALGDFRIIREIGRGGMGVVYEAEQLSLARRVALKVLPFASMLDPRHLQRFRNEALAAASLKHPNIVSVYCVGCERGVHFYAMEYVEGQTLAAVVEALRLAVAGTATLECPGAPGSPLLLSNGAESRTIATLTENQSCDKSQHSKDTVVAALSTLRTERPRDFFRTVAELGIQAAEALDHAHQLGIVHRDIKPSNLMIESSHLAECSHLAPRDGASHHAQRDDCTPLTTDHRPLTTPHLFITDFGLARIESEVTLTLTGDLLGTLRYMSPEQAEGRNAILDHRTDIYSLGITLYEIATLRPAFVATDRQTLLRQITNDEPLQPRQLNKAIPVDLETILLKAIRKEPTERYSSARHLAADLRRFVDQQPIKARRPTGLDRVRRWVGRHVALVGVSLLTLAIVAAAGIAATILIARAYRSEADERTKAQDSVRLAAEAIDRMLTRAAGQRYTQGQVQFAESLAADATSLYEELLARSDEPELKFRAANALVQVAHLRIRLGQHEHAQDAYGRASELLTPLANTSPGRDDYLCALAIIESGHGEALFSLGRHAEAAEPYRRALTVAEQLVERFPDNTSHQIALADRFNNLGVALTFSDRLDEAEKCFERSAEVERELPIECSQSIAGLDRQSCLLLNWASLARERGEYDRAIELLEQSATGRGLVLATAPEHPGNKVQSYNHYWNLAYAYVKAGRQAEAAATVEKMIAAYPDWLQANHEGAHILLLAANRAEDSVGNGLRAVPTLPQDELLGATAGLTSSGAPELPSATSSASAAEEYRRRARELLAVALTARVRNPDTTDRLAWFLLTCWDESFRDAPAAIKLAQSVVNEVPDRPTAWYTLALAHYRIGQWEAAEQAQQKSATLFGVANAYNWALVSMIRFQQGQHGEAGTVFERAHSSLDDHQKKDDDLVGLITEAGKLIESHHERKTHP